VNADSPAGNVKVANMPEDIHASTSQFSIAVSIFYVTYVLFESPWAVLMKKLTPRNILTGLCIVWSLTTIFTGFIKSVGSLYATRLILGACEAGLFPCLNLYLTMVYRREEQAKRVSYLLSCAAISGAVGGLLAYAILHMDGVAGKAGWRYVFVVNRRISHGFSLTDILIGGSTSSKVFSAPFVRFSSGLACRMILLKPIS
jgi:MFS family permease